MGEDPERQRIDELLARLGRGELGEAEREELALYVEEEPALQAEIDTRRTRAELGAGWLARVETDRQLARAERSPRIRIERGVGLALVIGGLVLSAVVPVTGSAATIAGLVILLVSMLRVHFVAAHRDPYKDVEE